MKLQLAIIFFFALFIACISARCHNECSSCLGSTCTKCYSDAFWNPEIRDCVSFCNGIVNFSEDAHGGAGVCFDTFDPYHPSSLSSTEITGIAVTILSVVTIIICAVGCVCVHLRRRRARRVRHLAQQHHLSVNGEVVVVGIPVQQEVLVRYPNKRQNSFPPEIKQIEIPERTTFQDPVIIIHEKRSSQVEVIKLPQQSNEKN